MADVIVGRFALIDLIAKGGSGSVWRAWDSKAERVCAAKVLRQRDSADLMRFVREKGVSFDHPHLLTPYGWGAEDEHVVIAMPLVSGGTLETMIRKTGKLSEPTVVVLLDQLLDGLAHVHAAGWIHRDVKPANLMFEPRGRAFPHLRLADFGIAVHDTDVRFTHVGMVNGTPGFMAPELFAMAEPAPSHDVYAAGVVALMALNGPIKLHDGAFREDELKRHLQGVSPQLAGVLRKMLAAQPDQRYQRAEDVRKDLPSIPRGQALGYADGTPLDITDTLPPLPPDAPGVGTQRRPDRSANAAAMEQIRAGQVPQTKPGQRSGPAPGSGQRSGPPQGSGQRSGPAPGSGPRSGPPQGGGQHSGPQAGSGPMRGTTPPQQPGRGTPPGNRPMAQQGPAPSPRGPQGNAQAHRNGGPGGPTRGSGPIQGQLGASSPAPAPRRFNALQSGNSPHTGQRTPDVRPTGARAVNAYPTGPHSAASTNTTGPFAGMGAAKSSRSDLVKYAVAGGIVVMVLLVIAVAALMLLLPREEASTQTGAEAYGVVSAGQSCAEGDIGMIGVTRDGDYLSCKQSPTGPVYQ